MHNLLELSNFAAVSELLARFTDQPACSAIKRLISLFGSEEIIEEVRQIISGVPEAENALSYLENLYALLDSAGYTEKIKLDFSMVNQLDYYTGVLFRGYVSGVGNCVLSGGRYDNLIGTFGRKMPATGFAIDIDALSSGLPPIHRTKTVELVHYEEEDIKKAYEYIGSRPAGSCELSSCGELSDTIELARNKKITRIVVLGDKVTEIEVEP